MKYYLENFIIDYRNGFGSYYGCTVFTEMEGSKRKWERKRKIAYEGSTTHFFTALYAQKLKEEGFKVQKAQDVPDFGRVLDLRDTNIYEYLRK